MQGSCPVVPGFAGAQKRAWERKRNKLVFSRGLLIFVPKWNGNARSALGLGEPRGLSLFQGKIFSPNPLNLPSGPVLSLGLRNLESPVLLPRIDDVPPYRVRNKIGDL